MCFAECHWGGDDSQGPLWCFQSAVCKLCNWKGRTGNESRGWRRSTLVRGSGLSSVSLSNPIYNERFFVTHYKWNCVCNSCIWSSWTNLKGSLWHKEPMIRVTSSSPWTWPGHSSGSSRASCFTVYLQRHSTSSTAETPPTDPRNASFCFVLILCGLVRTSLCPSPNKKVTDPIAPQMQFFWTFLYYHIFSVTNEIKKNPRRGLSCSCVQGCCFNLALGLYLIIIPIKYITSTCVVHVVWYLCNYYA